MQVRSSFVAQERNRIRIFFLPKQFFNFESSFSGRMLDSADYRRKNVKNPSSVCKRMNCRKLLFGALAAFLSLASNAQTSRDSVYVKAELNTYSINYDKALPEIERFIEGNSLLVKRKTQDFETVRYDLVMTAAQYNEIKHRLEEWKFAVIDSKEQTIDLSRKIENHVASMDRLKADISLLQKKKEYIKGDTLLYELDGQIYDKNEKLRQESREYAEDCASIGTVNLDLYLMRDETSPSQTKVRFVNMPGFEYSFLMVGNPKPGFSAKYYDGYNLKYIFTKGKTFVDLGVFKARNVAEADSTTLTDAFNISFGQDFYSRHFGRGARKFLNMYSGYNLGFMMYSGEKRSTKTVYLSPTVGVELFKNRYVLWDLRGAYYVPIMHNYDLRGWQFSMSFNVAF